MSERVLWTMTAGPLLFEVVHEGIGSRLERIATYEVRDSERHLLSTPPVSFLEAALLNVLRQGQFEDFQP